MTARRASLNQHRLKLYEQQLSLMLDTPDLYGLIRFIDDIVVIVVLDRDKPYLTLHRV